jgi:hypothetical protein
MLFALHEKGLHDYNRKPQYTVSFEERQIDRIVY